jgi:hypothetical protein
MPSKSPISGGRRIQTRRSAVHGNGVFAVQDLAEGETLIEYKGEIRTTLRSPTIRSTSTSMTAV